MNISKIFTHRIYISPGGLRGFYTYGICKYLKAHYNLSNYKYYGASAGAWNSLYMSIKDEKEKDFSKVLNGLQDKRPKSLYNLQKIMKKNILENFDENDFNLDNLNIYVFHFEKYRLRKNIYNNFNDLDDTLGCCMASSHIPIISGRIRLKYRNKYCIDGGLYGFVTQNDTDKLVIYPEMFNFNFNNNDKIKNFNTKVLIENGYNDAKKNSKLFDKYLIKK